MNFCIEFELEKHWILIKEACDISHIVHFQMAASSSVKKKFTEKRRQTSALDNDFKKLENIFINGDYFNFTDGLTKEEQETEYGKRIMVQLKVEENFFGPHSADEETKTFAYDLLRKIKNRMSEEDAILNKPARQWITAERSLLMLRQHINRYYVRHNWYIDADVTKQLYNPNYPNNEFTSWQYVKITERIELIKYARLTNPTKDHIGNYYLDGIGEYKAICESLKSLTGEDKDLQSALIELMVISSATGNAVDGTMLKNKKFQNVNDNIVVSLNRIVHNCFVKEPVRFWFHLPLATAQCRAVKLVKEKFLTLDQVFGQDSQHGVFTRKGIAKNFSNRNQDENNILQKINRISDLYEKEIEENEYYTNQYMDGLINDLTWCYGGACPTSFETPAKKDELESFTETFKQL